MTEMVKLQAPEGFTDVSFGGQSYEVDENGVVEVPAEAAQFLYQFVALATKGNIGKAFRGL